MCHRSVLHLEVRSLVCVYQEHPGKACTEHQQLTTSVIGLAAHGVERGYTISGALEQLPHQCSIPRFPTLRIVAGAEKSLHGRKQTVDNQVRFLEYKMPERTQGMHCSIIISSTQDGKLWIGKPHSLSVLR